MEIKNKNGIYMMNNKDNAKIGLARYTAKLSFSAVMIILIFENHFNGTEIPFVPFLLTLFGFDFVSNMLAVFCCDRIQIINNVVQEFPRYTFRPSQIIQANEINIQRPDPDKTILTITVTADSTTRSYETMYYAFYIFSR